MIKRSIIADNGITFDPYVRGLGDDILFSLHVYEHVKTVAYIQKPIYHYRVLNVSYSHGFKANLLNNYRLIFDKMEEYLKRGNKEKLQWDGYYLRVYYYVEEANFRYFHNEQNPASAEERFAEFKSVLNTEPYRTAIRKVPVSIFPNKREWIHILMLRFGFYGLYWKLKRK